MNAPDNLIYEFGPFLLEPHARRLSRNGEPVPLAAPEFELLLILVRNRGRVVEKREIMSAVWPDAEVEENNLTVRMSSLRRALGETKEYHPYIQTVPGRGYCLITEVKELPAQSSTNTISEKVPDVNAVQSESSVALPSRAPITVARRNWTIRGFTLYALLLVGLLATSLVFVMLWRHKGDRSQASVQSMKMTRVTQTGRVMGAAVSPDGQNVAYVERDGELHSLWLQRAGTTNPLQLLAPAKLSLKDPAFSRDGHTLYYSKCEPNCRLHRMPVLGGVETALPVRVDCPVTFSPDGSRMAYMRAAVIEKGNIEWSLIAAKSDGTGEEVLHVRRSGTEYQSSAPAWSPDGKVIALPLLLSEGGRSYMKVLGVAVADHAESTLTSQRWRFIKDVVWLPDGSSLVINGRDETSAADGAMQIWHVPLNGSEARRITNDLNNYWRIGLSADGSSLITIQVQWTSGLSTVPVENTSAVSQVTHRTIDRHDGNLGVAMMPDGRLIYASSLGGKNDLWSIDADGSGRKQLTDQSHRDRYPAVTPDGRYIVFESMRDGANNIWRVDADGRNPTRLTRGRYDSEPVCSPDGKWVVYVGDDDSGSPTLRKVAIEGGEPVQLTNEFAQHPMVSSDGKVIAYYRMNKEQRDQRHIILIPAQGGAPIKTIPVPKNFGGVVRWPPGSDSLSYRDSSSAGIWRLPLDGAPATPLLTLRGERIFTFCYSQDGKQLAYASGPFLSDVILITRFN